MRPLVLLAIAVQITFLAHAVSAECGGNLDMPYINDVTTTQASNNYNLHFTVHTDEEPYGVFRNIDVVLYDPNSVIVGRKSARFDNGQRDTTLDFYFPISNALIDGSYRIRIEMTVPYQNDSNNIKCGRIVYSNYFDINTNRVGSNDQPFQLNLDVQNTWSTFDVRKRNCSASYCVQVNMSGMKPANMTIDPQVNVNTPQDLTSISVSADGCYPGSYLIQMLQNSTTTASSIADCNARVNSISDRLVTELATSQKANADMLDKFDQCMKQKTDADAYQTAHPYTVEEIAIPSILVGMILLFVIIAWYNKRGHKESPQERLH